MMGDVFDLMKKSVLFSVGLVAFTVEKTGEIIDDFIKKGDQALEKHQDTIEKLKKIEADIEEKIKTQVGETLEKMNIPTKKDIDELNKKLDQIAKKI
jgi:polyhydroxyalkanoate synthesis regulator phasin